MKYCKSCEQLDHSIIYRTNIPQYKCERYGCIVSITDKCKGEKEPDEWTLCSDAAPEIVSDSHSDICLVTLQNDEAERCLALGRYWDDGEWEIGDLVRSDIANEGEVIAWKYAKPYSKPLDVCRTCILSDTEDSIECEKCGGKDDTR